MQERQRPEARLRGVTNQLESLSESPKKEKKQTARDRSGKLEPVMSRGDLRQATRSSALAQFEFLRELFEGSLRTPRLKAVALAGKIERI